MDFNATIDLIIKDLNEAREIIDDLKRYPGVPAIQVELAKSKCRNAGDIISLLKNMKEDDSSVKDAGKVVPDEVATSITHSGRTNLTGEPEPVPEHPFEQRPDDKDEKEHVIDVTENKEEVTVNKEKDRGSSIIADKYNNLSTRLNEQMGGKKGEDDLGGVLKSKPLADLSDAIGINDRFLFIREIFNGNKDTYNQAISRLNNAASMDDARNVITGYTGDRSGNDAVKQLLDLVKRKFPHNE